MAEPYKKITITVTKGKCDIYKPGDQIIFEDNKIKGSICESALLSLLPIVHAMRYGVQYPWLKEDTVSDTACLDGANPVLFEIKRS